MSQEASKHLLEVGLPVVVEQLLGTIEQDSFGILHLS